MKAIRANLRMGFSPPWAGWMFLAAIVAGYGILVLLEARGERHGGLSWSWFWAHLFLFTGRRVTELGRWHYLIWAPLSFVLPGYSQSLRRSNLVRAVRWGILVSLALFSETWNRAYLFEAFFDVPESPFVAPGLPEISLNVFGGFLAAMAAHLLWTSGPLVRFWWGWLLTSSAGVVLTVVVWFLALRYPSTVWPILAPLSTLLCGFLWFRLRDANWVRSGHRRMLLLGIGDPSEKDSDEEDSGEPEVETEVSPRVEEFFLSRMRGENSRAETRCWWGWLYCALGPILSEWQWFIILLLAGALVLGFLGRQFAELAFVLLGMPLTRRVWCASSTVLVPEGRREKYYRTVASGVLAALLLIASAASLVALSQFLAAFLLPILPGTDHVPYAGISIGSVWLACLFVPWLLLSFASSPGRVILHYAIPVAVGVLVFIELHGVRGSPILPAVLLICSWLLFLLVAWISYRRWDLVGQRPIRGD